MSIHSNVQTSAVDPGLARYLRQAWRFPILKPQEEYSPARHRRPWNKGSQTRSASGGLDRRRPVVLQGVSYRCGRKSASRNAPGGIGFSPDRRTIAVVSIGSNSVAFIDTATNTVKHITYVGRAPHEAFWTPDGKEVWVTVRGENYVDVLDGKTFEEKTRIITPPGPGMTIFSPNDKYGYVCSSFNPVTDVISVASHKIVATVKQTSPFCPNIAATPDGKQVWITLKDTGRTQVFNANPPFNTLKILDTGPITDHVNIVHNANGTFAYVTIGGLNEVKVFRTDDFSQAATIPVGALPHGLWPSGDGTRIYVGLENGDAVTAIDTLTNKVIGTTSIGQAPQALTYVPDAVPSGERDPFRRNRDERVRQIWPNSGLGPVRLRHGVS